MTLKKIALLFVVSVMALSMVGCNKKTADDGESKSSKNTEGKLVWATNAEFPPYEFRENDEVVGIDAEIANYIGERLGLEVEVEDMSFDSVLAAVQSGKADLALAGLTVNEERKLSVNFSDTYIKSSQVIIVKNDSPISTVDDLNGKKVAVQLGTTGDIYASDIEDVTIDRYSKGFEAVQALKQGKVDAVVIDEQPAKSFVGTNNDIKILKEKLTEEEYAIAISKDNEELLEKVNTILAEMKDNGKMDEIIAKYIGE